MKTIYDSIIKIITLIALIVLITAIWEKCYERFSQIKNANDWVNNGYYNCVIEDKNQNLNVVRILLQDGVAFNNGNKRAFLYDFNDNRYQSNINIDPINGLNFGATLTNENDIRVYFDFRKYSCKVEISNSNPPFKDVYNKRGYFAYSSTLYEVGDWQFSKLMQELQKKGDN